MPESIYNPPDHKPELCSTAIQYSHVRVYISSVFQDKQYERDVIDKLYSRFREISDSMGIQFQIVDLRYEMKDEIINDILVAQLCREEVAYSRRISLGPSLVILAGMRYGFRPLPDTIRCQVVASLTQAMNERSAKNLFNDWFRIDSNSLSNDYSIVPVSTRFKYFLSQNPKHEFDKFTDRLRWQNENNLIGRFLRRAAKTVFPNDKLKLNSSVFELEISEGLLHHHGNPNEHCLCFKTQIIDIHKFMLSHDVTKYIDVLPDSREIDQEAHKALNALKEIKIPKTGSGKGIGAENIFEHKLIFGQDLIDTNKSESFREYLTDFENSLKSSVERLIQNCSVKVPNILSSHLSNEAKTHLEFATNMSELKCGFLKVAENCVASINSYIASSDMKTPMVLFGRQGCGKTSVISRIVTRLANTSEVKLVVRYIGLTLNSQSICPLLRSVCLQLTSILGLTNQNPPSEYTQLKAYFVRLMNEQNSTKVVIFLDGVDYLDFIENGDSVDWLPKHLAPNFRLILTTRPEVDRHTFPGALSLLKNSDSFLELTPIPEPELSLFLSSLLSAHNRKMTSSQFNVILGFMRSSSLVTPFYVSLLLRDSIKWKSYSRIDQSELSVSVAGMLHSILAKLEIKYSKLFVTECLSIITVARFGVTECELQDLLSSNLKLKQELTPNSNQNQRISPIFWARLKLDLKFPFLVHIIAPGSYCVIKWGHSIFRDVALQRYLSSPDKIVWYHRLMADYHLNSRLRNLHILDPKSVYHSNAVFTEECEYFNPRNMLELPLHLVETGQTRVLIGLLTDLRWLMLKIESIGIFELLKDFAFLFDNLPSNKESELIGQLRILKEALQISYNSIGRDPKCLPQKLTSHFMAFVFKSEPMKSSGLRLRNPKIDTKYALLIGLLKSAQNLLTPPNLIPLSPSNERIGSEFVYDFCNHGDEITCIRIKDTNVTSGMLVLSSSKDTTLKLWELKTGRLLLTFVGHESSVTSCDMSISATLAISGATDATIRLWDTKTANCLQQLKSHSDSVTCVSLTKNGRVGLSAGCDGRICIWNCHRDSSCFGDINYSLQAHNQPIRCLALFQNDRMFVTGSDDTFVRVWNVASSHNCGVMRGHNGAIVSVSVWGDTFLTSSSDGTVRTWSNDCSLIQSIPANSYTINCVCLSQSNCLFGVLCSNSGKIMHIDPETGICKNTISAHSCGIKCVAMTTDGMWGVTGDENGTIKIWLIGREPLLEGFSARNSHEGMIGRIRYSPCEQFLVTIGVDGYVSVLDLCSCKEELTLWAHSQPISDVAIHKDSVKFVTAGEDRKLKLWHGEKARLIGEFYGHNVSLSSVTFSEDGELLASADKRGNIFIWRTEDFDWLLELESEITQPISDLQFVYKDNILYLLVGCQDGTVTLWNVNQGTLVSTFHTSDSVTCLDVISHKWQAVCGTRNGSVHKWMIGSDTSQQQLALHSGSVTGVRCLNKLDPIYVAVSCLKGYIHLLDYTELILLASFCLGECITSIDCNLSGTVVAYSSVSGFIGLVGVSSSLEDNLLFKSGPYLFKPNDKISQFGEYTQSYPMLTDNLDDVNGLLEFSEQFEALSANETPDFEHIYLVPRRPGVLAPISEISDEETEENPRRKPTNQIASSIPELDDSNFSNTGEPITSKICNIL